MNVFQLTLLSVALGSLTLSVHAQTAPRPNAPAAVPKAAPAASGSNLVDPALVDLLAKEQASQGRPDTPELRNAIREELTNRKLLEQAARSQGMHQKADVKGQMELSSQTVLIRAYLAEVSKTKVPSDAALLAEYERIKAQMGAKEYRARHILVEKKEEADDIVKALQAGQKFEDLASRSKDEGSKVNGGDLDWAAPGNFVPAFSAAMTSLEKGKFTAQPVQTQFGWHVIRLDDTREAKPPSFEEVKPQLTQGMQNRIIDEHVNELRKKAGL